jgi:membrane protein YqaA with SNARE-associated domain
MSKLRQYLPHILALVFAVGIIVAVPFLPIKWDDLKGYGYLGVFLINVIGSATIIFPVPGLAVAFMGGGVDLNPWLVALLGAAGSTIGETTGWLAGWGGQVVAEKNKHYAQVESWMRRHGDVTVFVMAAIPNPLFDIAGMVSGSLRYPLWRFLGAAFLGKLVKYTVVTLLGAASMQAILPFFK